ncbi:uncharacterized protein C2845_PM08G05790 [Panicum miliaceum]|uniref:Uncharacterized protein n=1 Tax=Panicum miliaceum TaxID=4540 RepID=A0A3L6R5B7_PANMI|nr:uncharacterized protein C2845_PM08G05790 [Panicum miliaceum]
MAASCGRRFAGGDAPARCCNLERFLEATTPVVTPSCSSKICSLAKRFPELQTLRSCDLSPASWISVAWYPIYGIPAGPTQRDLDACFLTYHSLSTQFAGALATLSASALTWHHRSSALRADADENFQESSGCPCFARRFQAPAGPATARAAPVTAMFCPSYKLKGAAWTPGWRVRQVAASLAQAADAWIRLLRADHPDHRFFAARRAPSRRW